MVHTPDSSFRPIPINPSPHPSPPEAILVLVFLPRLSLPFQELLHKWTHVKRLNVILLLIQGFLEPFILFVKSI